LEEELFRWTSTQPGLKDTRMHGTCDVYTDVSAPQAAFAFPFGQRNAKPLVGHPIKRACIMCDSTDTSEAKKKTIEKMLVLLVLLMPVHKLHS
jgi:hypothetical protein